MKKTYCFDIDLTICETSGTKYEEAKPIISRISQINKLKEDEIDIFYTARGFVSKIDYYELTYNQLNSWE